MLNSRNPNSPLAPSPLLKDEPASGLDCSGDFKAAPDIRTSGPAAGGGYVLRAGPKVKVAGIACQNRSQIVRIGMRTIKDLAGRSGRARTCDPRFWRPVLYQLSYTPVGLALPPI